MKGNLTSLREVQETLLSFINADTILIGHGLETDLCALKVTTVSFFQHDVTLQHTSTFSSGIYCISPNGEQRLYLSQLQEIPRLHVKRTKACFDPLPFALVKLLHDGVNTILTLPVSVSNLKPCSFMMGRNASFLNGAFLL